MNLDNYIQEAEKEFDIAYPSKKLKTVPDGEMFGMNPDPRDVKQFLTDKIKEAYEKAILNQIEGSEG